MKSFPSELLTEITKQAHVRTYLVKIQFSYTVYFTPFNEKLLYGGQWYVPRNISFKSSQVSMLAQADRITIDISNSDKLISNLVLSENIEGSPVTIYEAYLDLNGKVLGAWVIFFGYVDRYKVMPKKGTIDVYNHLLKFKMQTPRFVHGAACRWEFKKKSQVIVGTDSNQYTCIFDHAAANNNRPITGAFWRMFWALGGSGGSVWAAGAEYQVNGCNYAGAGTDCDQSRDRCVALGNQANFGGFPWQPYLADKDIWWGSGAHRNQQ